MKGVFSFVVVALLAAHISARKEAPEDDEIKGKEGKGKEVKYGTIIGIDLGTTYRFVFPRLMLAWSHSSFYEWVTRRSIISRDFSWKVYDVAPCLLSELSTQQRG